MISAEAMQTIIHTVTVILLLLTTIVCSLASRRLLHTYKLLSPYMYKSLASENPTEKKKQLI